MAQFMGVPGPSQDEFNALSGQVTALNSKTVKATGVILSASNVTSDTYVLGLNPGVYKIAGSKSAYLPISYGTLVKYSSDMSTYGFIEIKSSEGGHVYCRHYNGTTWLETEWNELALNSNTPKMVAFDTFPSGGATRTYTLTNGHMYLIIGGQPYSEGFMAICAAWTGGSQRITIIKSSNKVTASMGSSDNVLTLAVTGNMWIRIVDYGYYSP